MDSRLLFLREYSVGREPKWCFVRFNQPHPPSLEIFNQLLIAACAHIPRPDNFRTVNICRVVDPIQKNFVLRFITHEHQMLPGFALQPVDNSSPLNVMRILGVPGMNNRHRNWNMQS